MLAVLGIASLTQLGADAEMTPPQIAVDDTTTTTAIGTSTVAVTPAEFVYRIGVLAGVSTDNFWAFYGAQPSVWNSYVLGPTKPALYTVDPATGALEPELATSRPDPEQSAGDWRVTVDLRVDMAWSDGTPVTADDLVFTFETVRRLGLEGSWADSFPDEVTSVTALGRHRVEIDFSERPRLAVWPHAVGLAPVMARHVWGPVVEKATAEELYDMSGDSDVGGGPLAVASISEDRIISRANAGYPFPVAPDTVEYHIYADEASAVNALAEGDIDLVLNPNGLSARHLGLIEDDPAVELTTSPGNAIRYVGFNLEREPMAEEAFRDALALLVDRDGLDAGPVAWSLVPETNAQWYDEEAVSQISSRYERPLGRRLGEAVKGLRAAGYEWEKTPAVEDGSLVAGEGLTIDGRAPQPLTILTPGDEYDPDRGVYVDEMAGVLGILGFDARPVETDFDTVVDLAFTPGEDGALQYDMYMLGWTLGSPALPGYYRALFAADGALNNTGYDSGEFAAALEDYEGAYTTDQAFVALWEMERTLATDLPYLLLYTSEITEAYRSDAVSFGAKGSLGGIQARLGGIWDVTPAG